MRKAISTGRLFLLFLVLAAAADVRAASDEARLLRFPDIHGDTIAFVYAGDLWTVPASGGTARRLTSDVGMELFPKFSPDGGWIAYSAEYSGNRQVWVIPTAGGEPRQLTYYNDVGSMPPRGGFDNQVLGWTPDGTHVLFRANRLPWGVRMGRPYLVPFEGGSERPLDVPESGGGTFSPDGKRLAYTPISREFRTWKRYHGGRAQDVWIFDLEKLTAEPITEYDGTDNQPVWIGDKIFFTSDRERRLALYAYDTRTRQTTRVAGHDDYDVLWPSGGPRRVVYECGGYLWIYDPQAGSDEQVHVQIAGDFAGTLPRFESVENLVGAMDVSPSGKRAVFEARGDVFTVPAEHGEARNLTRTPGVREMDPSWSPDGRFVAYLSDRTGEYEIWVRAQDGSGDERRVTTDGEVWRFAPLWSPDGSRLLFGDRRQRLRFVEVESGRVVDVDRSPHGDIRSYAWSPDSRWVVYDKVGDTQMRSIWVRAADGGEPVALTDGMTNDYGAVFDPEGRYLYFLSDRDYNLTFSGYEFNYLYTDPGRIYVATVRSDGPALLVPRSDEEQPGQSGDEPAADDAGKKGDKKAAKKSDEKPEGGDAFRIDADGFASRVVALPGPSGGYRSLAATSDGLYFIRRTDDGTELARFGIEDEKVETVLEGALSFVPSRDGKKLLYRDRGGYGITDAKPGRKAGDGRLDLSGLQMKVDPPAEWAQIFADAWRITRDWFYDPGMHGVDWDAVRRLYEPMVAHVAHRADLDFILGEMGGELSSGHYYVNWGDMPRPERHDGGLLGAEIVPHESGYFRVARIFAGENWHGETRSPLTMPGVDVREGDFILAVDGRSTRDVKNFYELLENATGHVVVLRVNERPEEAGSREESVRPIARETELRYLDWVRSRREMVDRLSGGRIGYIHLPNTAVDGNRELRKYFYPLSGKDALILDARYNGGGFIPDRMVELLTRTRLSFWKTRADIPTSTPQFVHEGPKVCLMNGYSSSGGDAFPYYFRELGLGKLIGRRTWGGLIGLSGNPGFIDGGSINVPTFRFIDPSGNWAVEGVGVEPDIDVLDRPDLVARGEDPTLERAVRELLDELKRNPPAELEVPAPPRLGR